MQYPLTFVTMLTLPASAGAHIGPDQGVGVLERMIHLLTEHYALGLLGALVAAALLLRLSSAQRKVAGCRHIDNDRKESEP